MKTTVFIISPNDRDIDKSDTLEEFFRCTVFANIMFPSHKYAKLCAEVNGLYDYDIKEFDIFLNQGEAKVKEVKLLIKEVKALEKKINALKSKLGKEAKKSKSTPKAKPKKKAKAKKVGKAKVAA